MISEQHECVFVHVPKTGGQSVELFFLRLLGLDWDSREPLLLAHNADRARGPERLAHLYAREYLELGYLDVERFEKYFKFAFVRNPWSRLVSEYRYRSYGQRYSFSEFVRDGLPEPDDYTDAHRHIVPQVSYLYDESGKQLVDFVGRFERLQADFDKICERIGFEESVLPRRNVSGGQERAQSSGVRGYVRRLIKPRGKPSGKSSYVDFYDAYTKDLVADMYKADIECFGYEFDDGGTAN